MIYFLSDIHLGAAYITDRRAHEQRVVSFLDHIAGDATELFLLGDILDYWFEYRYVVPRGYIRFFAALARLADAGVKITWLTGNHDVWLRDYLRDEIGLNVLYGKTVVNILGSKFLISHGDDAGHQPPLYRFTRAMFYSRFNQWLYAAIHPRWTAPIALGWSKQNRTARDPDKVRQRIEQCAENLINFSLQSLKSEPDLKYFVFGHLHLARETKLDSGQKVVFLGDWINQDTYATFDGQQLLLEKWEKG